MPNATYSPFATPVEAAIAGFDRPDDLQFINVRELSGWRIVYFGYPEPVKNRLKGFTGTYQLLNRHGVAIGCLITIVR